MRVLLVHNASAGDGDNDPQLLRSDIEAAGHAVEVVSGKDSHWIDRVTSAIDLVAVSGGDGTIGRSAKAMVGRDVPIAMLPAGTANNIARTFGLEPGPAREHVARWAGAKTVRVDIPLAVGPWGVERIVEGIGCGLFSASIEVAEDATKHPDLAAPDRVARALEVLCQRANSLPSIHVHASVDGRDISGHYLVLEAMNTRFVGPNLFLAPDADPGDGLLDVVLVRDDERKDLVEHLAAWRRGHGQVPALRVERGANFEMQWSGFDLHYDDETWPCEDAAARMTVRFGIDGSKVAFLVPA